MIFWAAGRGVEVWNEPVDIPAEDPSIPRRDSASSSLDWYGRAISSGLEDRHRPEASQRRRCASYSGPGIVATMPGSGLFRVNWLADRLVVVWQMFSRHSPAVFS